MKAKSPKPEFARRITQQLDSLPLSAKAQARLSEMQALALAHSAVAQPRWAGVAGWVSSHWHAHPAAWASALALCTLAVVGTIWQMETREFDAELETRLLSDEIPLESLINAREPAWSADSR
ncbi:Protein of unknown function [Andreprevotia lacus DSM 23236]|jgi:hypothetical protein|uniref:DUF3619 family protein n=1 Tax=Andreprevotia lacus DSM 23236 TaxID=1121001 RepID=A0A1W1Y102_9NEIS|nr:DUF3619 family protein [Andreprevotia lacus]SMC29817.1 Protein of unknown function [Andreprevotia lacus DSM 23236]